MIGIMYVCADASIRYFNGDLLKRSSGQWYGASGIIHSFLWIESADGWTDMQCDEQQVAILLREALAMMSC